MCKVYLAISSDAITEPLKFLILAHVIELDSETNRFNMWTPWFSDNRIVLFVECIPNPSCFLLDWHQGDAHMRLCDSFLDDMSRVKIYVSDSK